MKNYFNKGFTLAEVLITLAIIGVVAAMTVPTLMTSTRGKEYEVGAQKALSTIANAMQMRYAMDGVTLADFRVAGNAYQGSWSRVRNYLTLPPGDRPGEKPALQVSQENDFSFLAVFKLKDGMIVIRSIGSDPNGPHYVVIDTNGEKGPTRIHMYGDDSYTTPGTTLDSQEFKTRLIEPEVTIDETDVSKNLNPDVVVFLIDPHTGSVRAAGQRTRNILATGNAMISQ